MCPARITRCARPSVVRATTAAPSVCTVRCGSGRSAAAISPASRCSEPLTDSISASAAVRAAPSAERSSPIGGGLGGRRSGSRAGRRHGSRRGRRRGGLVSSDPAAAAPATAAPPADMATSHRPTRGSSSQAATVASTSMASDSAPTPIHMPRVARGPGPGRRSLKRRERAEAEREIPAAQRPAEYPGRRAAVCGPARAG